MGTRGAGARALSRPRQARQYVGRGRAARRRLSGRNRGRGGCHSRRRSRRLTSRQALRELTLAFRVRRTDGNTSNPSRDEDRAMLKWAIIFLIISLVAGALGFTGVAAGAATI